MHEEADEAVRVVHEEARVVHEEAAEAERVIHEEERVVHEEADEAVRVIHEEEADEAVRAVRVVHEEVVHEEAAAAAQCIALICLCGANKHFVWNLLSDQHKDSILSLTWSENCISPCI